MASSASANCAAEPGNADVPGDVPPQLRFGNAEPAEHTRNEIAGMVGDQQKRRCPAGIANRYRRRLVDGQQLCLSITHRVPAIAAKPAQYLAQEMHISHLMPGTFAAKVSARHELRRNDCEPKKSAMKIRAGYEISYDCPQPTPMILTLSVHPSRFPDLLTPGSMRLDPPISPTHITTVSAISAMLSMPRPAG